MIHSTTWPTHNLRTTAVLMLLVFGMTACGGGGGGGDGGGGPPEQPATASIVAQPTNQIVTANTPASFEVLATSATGFQWQISTDGGTTFIDVNAANAASYTTTATATDNGAQYRVIVSGTHNSVTSVAVTLTVTVAPSITVQPVPQMIIDGLNASFTVIASGTPINYQWQRSTNNGANFTDVAGATNTTLNLTAVPQADSGHQFRVVLTNSAGSVTSTAALLTVNPAPLLSSIIFTRETDTYEGIVSDIYLIKEDGSGLITLANSSSYNAYDANSGRVVYSYNDTTQIDLNSIKTDATGNAPLTITPDNEEFVGITASGRVIYRTYTRDEISGNVEYNLFSVNVNGGSNAALANTVNNEEILSITASGRVIYRDAFNDNLYAVNGDGTNKATLTNTDGTEDFLGSTASGRVIYRRTINAQYDIYSVNADGSGTVPLDNTSTRAVFLGITLGGRVIYAKNENSKNDIYSINADGSGYVYLTSGPYSKYVRKITDDERVIYESADINDSRNIFWAPADGASGGGSIATSADNETFAGITDDGQIIFKRLEALSGANLYCFTPGIGISTLANSLDSESFAGSINGRVLYHKEVNGQFDLYSVNTNGTDTQSLASSAAPEEFVRTTNTGQVIYRVNNGGQYDLYIVNADGTNPVTLANSANSEELISVTNNGRVIYRRLVNGQYDLYSVSTDGTVTVPLSNTANNETFQVLF